ncbi:unnamed protein product [Cuscuta campestris]|uniref:Uncharacterized protein n=1 Tax=Cuscuta campestris TaxID=132261 RepID=A0A484MAY9_9ASTE|nr:unnamed protein product [Cuscuta campestris]
MVINSLFRIIQSNEEGSKNSTTDQLIPSSIGTSLNAGVLIGESQVHRGLTQHPRRLTSNLDRRFSIKKEDQSYARTPNPLSVFKPRFCHDTREEITT